MNEESLADRVKRLQSHTAEDAKHRQMDAKYSRTARAREDIQVGGRFMAQFLQGCGVLWAWVFRPVLHYMGLKARILWRWYRLLWGYVVFRRTEDNVLVFAKTRAAGMIAASFIFFWFLLLPLGEFVWDTAIYLMTAQVDERVYLLGSQEINSTTGMHIIEGCSQLPCSDQDAIYFRTESSLFNNLWSLARGRGLFYPEYVGAAVPYTTSLCVVTSYGFRFRLPFRLANTYSYMLAVTCTPLGEGQRHHE